MKSFFTYLCAALLCASALAQTETKPSESPSYSNYSIMLVNPVPSGGAVVLMHNPKNGIEFIPVNNTKSALDAGYVAVRAAELAEFISALKEENARLTAENVRLLSESPKESTATQSQADLVYQQRVRAAQQAAAEKAAKREQMIQTWLMLQNMNRSQTLNVNVTDCSKFPATCVGK